MARSMSPKRSPKQSSRSQRSRSHSRNHSHSRHSDSGSRGVKGHKKSAPGSDTKNRSGSRKHGRSSRSASHSRRYSSRSLMRSKSRSASPRRREHRSRSPAMKRRESNSPHRRRKASPGGASPMHSGSHTQMNVTSRSDSHKLAKTHQRRSSISKSPKNTASESPSREWKKKVDIRREYHRSRSRSNSLPIDKFVSQRKSPSPDGAGKWASRSHNRRPRNSSPSITKGHRSRSYERGSKWRVGARSRSGSPRPQKSARASSPISIYKELANKSATVEDRHYAKKTFEPPENFTIKITRVKEPSSPQTKSIEIDRVYLPRKKGEGVKPLFERQELRSIAHLDFTDRDTKQESKKVISVSSRGDGTQYKPIGSSEMHMTGTLLSNRWKAMMAHAQDDNRVVDVVAPKAMARSRSRSPISKTVFHVSTRYPDKSQEPRGTAYRRQPSGKHLTTGDLRHSLQGRREDMRGGDDRSRPKRGSGEDLRLNIEERRAKRHMDDNDYEMGRSRGREGQDRRISSTTSPAQSRDARLHQPERRPERPWRGRDMPQRLPDFSRRPDKGQFEVPEWVQNPEMIPKGGYYYEHDDRDVAGPEGMSGMFGSDWSRGRGSRFFRGSTYRGRFGGAPRGGYRGNFRGRGGFRGRGPSFFREKSVEREWKHDKYLDTETEDTGEKPTSTT
ncbi:PREDICTED: E3 ubiquitin-protein ligase RBBP6-like isoform X2 [Priapulus caudatus]|uniref:E3 ubiquitin-protein ligase RBBP6-like isoform X2 n=1 Tax=Priapulus caudatus TaxID=37621 RepID=A0ABM1E3H4_PRICU|nr:PREDICTED: E3 ubiquitin-protein ligase RBBP6-like isoform X2 [Priapulus caudatus]